MDVQITNIHNIHLQCFLNYLFIIVIKIIYYELLIAIIKKSFQLGNIENGTLLEVP